MSSGRIKRTPVDAKRGKRSQAFGYIALHETNLALCLASGFLGPRYEASAAADHHSRSGRLVASSTPLSTEDERAAMGGLDYGAVVLVSISQPPVDAEGLPSSLPLAYARQVLFRSEAQLKSFQAGLGGYGDVPEGILDMAVDARGFGALPSNEALFQPDPGPRAIEPASLGLCDKLGGALAGLLFASRLMPEEGERVVNAALSARRNRASNAADLVHALGNAIDPKNTALAQIASEVLLAKKVGEGFDPSSFLKGLHELMERPAIAADSSAAAFVRHAEDIVKARREISDDAFKDVPGKIVPRALLLFILNQDSARWAALPKKVPNLGPMVFAVASTFMGLFSGLAALPVAIKAPTKDSFLALGLLIDDLTRGGPIDFLLSSKWNEQGARRMSLAFMGHEIELGMRAPSSELSVALAIAKDANLSPSIDGQTGIVTLKCANEVLRNAVQIRVAVSPTFPREPALHLSATIDVGGTRKEISSRVIDIANRESGSPIFLRLANSSKSKTVELSAYCPTRLASAATFAAAIEALMATATELSRAAMPVE